MILQRYSITSLLLVLIIALFSCDSKQHIETAEELGKVFLINDLMNDETPEIYINEDDLSYLLSQDLLDEYTKNRVTKLGVSIFFEELDRDLMDDYVKLTDRMFYLNDTKINAESMKFEAIMEDSYSHYCSYGECSKIRCYYWAQEEDRGRRYEQLFYVTIYGVKVKENWKIFRIESKNHRAREVTR